MMDDDPVQPKWMVFVDTNVLLDFYRLRGNNALEFLAQINEHKTSLILTRQVFMEFLKNRRKAILAAFSVLSKPTVQKLPPNLRGMDVADDMVKSLNDADVCYKKIKEKTDLIVSNPTEHDEVFNLVSRLFADLDQTREAELFQLAQMRSLKGYPPQKDKDTSFGDAMNWEEMLQAIEDAPEKTNLFIVSRDGDFSDGPRAKEINEWLLHEFKERFGVDREVILSESLSQAMELLGETVPQEAVEEENEVIFQTEEKTANNFSSSASFVDFGDQLANLADPLAKFQEQMASVADPLAKYN